WIAATGMLALFAALTAGMIALPSIASTTIALTFAPTYASVAFVCPAASLVPFTSRSTPLFFAWAWAPSQIPAMYRFERSGRTSPIRYLAAAFAGATLPCVRAAATAANAPVITSAVATEATFNFLPPIRTSGERWLLLAEQAGGLPHWAAGDCGPDVVRTDLLSSLAAPPGIAIRSRGDTNISPRRVRRVSL